MTVAHIFCSTCDAHRTARDVDTKSAFALAKATVERENWIEMPWPPGGHWLCVACQVRLRELLAGGAT